MPTPQQKIKTMELKVAAMVSHHGRFLDACGILKNQEDIIGFWERDSKESIETEAQLLESSSQAISQGGVLEGKATIMTHRQMTEGCLRFALTERAQKIGFLLDVFRDKQRRTILDNFFTNLVLPEEQTEQQNQEHLLYAIIFYEYYLRREITLAAVMDFFEKRASWEHTPNKSLGFLTECLRYEVRLMDILREKRLLPELEFDARVSICKMVDILSGEAKKSDEDRHNTRNMIHKSKSFFNQKPGSTLGDTVVAGDALIMDEDEVRKKIGDEKWYILTNNLTASGTGFLRDYAEKLHQDEEDAHRAFATAQELADSTAAELMAEETTAAPSAAAKSSRNKPPTTSLTRSKSLPPPVRSGSAEDLSEVARQVVHAPQEGLKWITSILGSVQLGDLPEPVQLGLLVGEQDYSQVVFTSDQQDKISAFLSGLEGEPNASELAANLNSILHFYSIVGASEYPPAVTALEVVLADIMKYCLPENFMADVLEDIIFEQANEASRMLLEATPAEESEDAVIDPSTLDRDAIINKQNAEIASLKATLQMRLDMHERLTTHAIEQDVWRQQQQHQLWEMANANTQLQAQHYNLAAAAGKFAQDTGARLRDQGEQNVMLINQRGHDISTIIHQQHIITTHLLDAMTETLTALCPGGMSIIQEGNQWKLVIADTPYAEVLYTAAHEYEGDLILKFYILTELVKAMSQYRKQELVEMHGHIDELEHNAGADLDTSGKPPPLDTSSEPPPSRPPPPENILKLQQAATRAAEIFNMVRTEHHGTGMSVQGGAGGAPQQPPEVRVGDQGPPKGGGGRYRRKPSSNRGLKKPKGGDSHSLRVRRTRKMRKTTRRKGGRKSIRRKSIRRK